MKYKFLLIGGLFCLSLFSFALVAKAADLDTDKDGLSDFWEDKFKTDINNPDSDGDGYKDGLELDFAYNPLSAKPEKLSQYLEIDTKNQIMTYFIEGFKWKEFKISSGKVSTPTPKGEFEIQNKITKAWSNSYGLWMPYWMGINSPGIGIHELPIWPSGYREGESHLGTPVSHGCIRLGVNDAPYLFYRLAIGTKVKVY